MPKLRFPEFRERSGWDRRPAATSLSTSINEPSRQRPSCTPYTVTDERRPRPPAMRSLAERSRATRSRTMLSFASDDFVYNKSDYESRSPQGCIERYVEHDARHVSSRVITCFRVETMCDRPSILEHLFSVTTLHRQIAQQDYVDSGCRAMVAQRSADDNSLTSTIPMPESSRATEDRRLPDVAGRGDCRPGAESGGAEGSQEGADAAAFPPRRRNPPPPPLPRVPRCAGVGGEDGSAS